MNSKFAIALAGWIAASLAFYGLMFWLARNAPESKD